jgi:outer membrane protein
MNPITPLKKNQNNIPKDCSVNGHTHKNTFNLIVGGLLGLWIGHAQAEDLLSIYHQAVQADPTSQAAEIKTKIAEAQKGQAFGEMLPQVNATTNWSLNSQRQDRQRNPVSDYYGSRYAISLNQTVLDVAKFYTWQKAKSVESQYQLENLQAEQNLLYQVTELYFNVLEAEDELGLYQTETELTQKEVEQIEQQYHKQMAKITDLYAIQSRLDQINANLVEAEAKVATGKQALQQLTNMAPNHLARLKTNIDYKNLEGKLDDWLHVAHSENPIIAAQHYAIEAADHDVTAQQARHLPVVEVQLNYYNTDTGFQNQQTTQFDNQVAAINVNVPIFSGGVTQHRVNEAQHRLALNKYDNEAKLREINKATSDAFLNVNASVKRIQANQKALDSATKASDAMTSGFNYGVQTMNDVLKAQDEEFKARHELTKAKYSYIKNRMQLLQAIGTISEDNLKEVNNWLEHNSTSTAKITTPTAPTGH